MKRINKASIVDLLKKSKQSTRSKSKNNLSINSKGLFQPILVSLVSIFLAALIVKAATTIGNNINTGGTLSVGSNATTSGNLVVGSSSWQAPTSTLTVDGSGYFTGNFLNSGNATTTGRLIVGGAPTNNFGKIWIGGDAYISGGATTTHNFYSSGFASSTTGLFTQGSSHIGGAFTVDGISTTTATTTIGGNMKVYTNDGTTTIEFLN